MYRLTCFSSVLILLMQISSSSALRQACGGTHTAARGILSTPNFPGPFDVPIRCQWIIDAVNTGTANTSIIVYLTQLFTFEGLTFTEYQLYGNDYKINPKVIHKVNETNVVRTKWVQTFRSYLVIELKLQSVDSAHLRVLDKFLDTYGFNITYEITTNSVRRSPCTMIDCGFTGICFDHYTKFSCNCFDGYSGPNCSEGPKSFCYTNGTPTCNNNGTCLHVGVAAVKCHCSKLFVGNTCETPVEPTGAKALKSCPNCPTNCTHNEKQGNTCKCLSAKPDMFGQTGIFATLHLGNLPSLQPNDLKTYIRTQLLNHLRTNLSKIEDVSIASLIHYLSGADVIFQIYGPKKDEKKVNNVLNKWIDRGYVGNITVAVKDSSIKAPLAIQSVDINQPGVIRENDEFILSCVARGSPSITFRWFKDGAFVNLTHASHKWIKLIKDPHVTDQYTALLAVQRAQKYDEGKFTCQVEDFNIQQCMSKSVKVKRRPSVKIEPMSLTVRKGQNFTVKCVTMEENGGIGGKYTYSWTKNKELLPVRTDSEKFETLYPAGTILQVLRIDKDVQYSCLVQDRTTSSEMSIQVYVLDREGVHTCLEESSYDLSWPETAPDMDYIQECPKGYSGTISRRCVLSDGKNPTWGIPDFSKCTSQIVGQICEKFELFKAGYTAGNFEKLLSSFLDYVSSVELRPGEGARILALLEEILAFLEQAKVGQAAIQNVTQAAVSMLDIILSTPDALLHPKEINSLQNVLLEQLRTAGSYIPMPENFKSFNLSLNSLDITVFREEQSSNTVYVPAANKNFRIQPWVSTKITFQLLSRPTANSEILAGIIYRNLPLFFPPKSFLRLRDGTEIQYQIYSQVMTLMPITINRSNKSQDVNLTIDFQHQLSTEIRNFSNNEKWEVRCGYADAKSFAYSWNMYTCSAVYLNDRASTCFCPKFGSVVLMLVLTDPEQEVRTDAPHKYILISSFVVGIILTVSTVICLSTSCFRSKNSCIIFLKLQCSISMLFCELLFAIAILVEPPQRYLMVYLSFLEMFILLGISSHMSKLLIIFTELIEVPTSMSSKYTVMSITSGVPLITIFANHLTYKTMNLNLKSWWMLTNSLASNMFIIVICIITGLFIMIYSSVIKRLKELVTRVKHEQAVEYRIALIERAGYLFFAILGFVISSMVYVNNQKALWSVYQFSATNVLMTFVLTTCYILNPEKGFRYLFKKRHKKEDNYFSTDSRLQWNFTKQETELETQIAHCRQDIQISTSTSLEPMKVTVKKGQSISNAFESCLQTSSTFCDVSIKEAGTCRQQKQENPTQQVACHSSPSGRKAASNNYSQSPDIITTKPCVGLDLVAHSMCINKSEIKSSNETPPLTSALKTEKKVGDFKTVRIMFPPQVIVTSDDSVSRIIEPEATEADSCTRTQPDGHAEIIVSNEIEQVTIKDDNLDGVLDSISHDLDYLLNRGDAADPLLGCSGLGRKSSVINNVPEELIAEESSFGTEGVMLRTNC